MHKIRRSKSKTHFTAFLFVPRNYSCPFLFSRHSFLLFLAFLSQCATYSCLPSVIMSK